MCGLASGVALAKTLHPCSSFSGSRFLLVSVSSQPGSEVSVYIPKQRLGLVRRGLRVEESLSPRFLRVHQSNTFTVTEDRDFVVVSIPAPLLLQYQVSILVLWPCFFLRDLLLGLLVEPEVREQVFGGWLGAGLTVYVLEALLCLGGSPSRDSQRTRDVSHHMEPITCCPTAMPRCQRIPRDTSVLQGGPEPCLCGDGLPSTLESGELFPVCG